MCGRTSLFPPAIELETRFDARLAADANYRPRYNIAPGSTLEVITNESPGTIEQFHWGLVPFWADNVDDGMINARSETAHEKRPFKDAWARRPCLVLTSGFYEWQQPNGGPKQPHRIYKPDELAFAMAGLWEETTIEDEPIRSVTILTTKPNQLVDPIHDRMPVVLTRESEDVWLSAESDRRRELCIPYPDDDLSAYAIDTRVNNPQHDDPGVISPADRTQSNMRVFGA